MQINTPEDIFDIYSPLPLPTFWDKYSTQVLLVSITLLLFTFTYLYYRHLKHKKALLTPASPLSPFDEVINNLIQARNQISEFSGQDFSSAITQALRLYLQKIFHLPFPQKTSEEFLSTLHSNQSLDSKSLELLAQILELTDLSKYAHTPLSLSDQESLYNKSYQFVSSINQVHSSIPQININSKR